MTEKKLENSISEKISLMDTLELSQFLMSATAESAEALERFLRSFNFANLRVDQALRLLCTRFHLSGEGQAIERVLHEFSLRYVQCNQVSLDTTFVLANAIAMLNTDLHNGNLIGARKMSRKEFIANTAASISPPVDISLLKSIYKSICKRPLPFPGDLSALNGNSADENCSSVGSERSSNSISSFLKWIGGRKVFQGGHAVKNRDPVYDGPQLEMKISRETEMLRKSVRDNFGIKSRRRKWRMLHVALRGSQLEFHNLKNPKEYIQSLPLRHAVSRLVDSQEPFIFSVELYQGGLYYFNALTLENALDWTQEINKAAAISTVPCPPVPFASFNSVFIDPLLPMQPSDYSVENQISSIRTRITQLIDEIYLHIDFLNGGEDKNRREFTNWDRKMEFLNREMKKYQIYLERVEEM